MSTLRVTPERHAETSSPKVFITAVNAEGNGHTLQGFGAEKTYAKLRLHPQPRQLPDVIHSVVTTDTDRLGHKLQFVLQCARLCI
jgi:hypothetical protein